MASSLPSAPPDLRNVDHGRDSICRVCPAITRQQMLWLEYPDQSGPSLQPEAACRA